VASFYKDWGGIGGTTNFLAWGDFPETDKEPESLYMPRGDYHEPRPGNVKPWPSSPTSPKTSPGLVREGRPKHPYEGKPNPSRKIRNTAPATEVHLAQGAALRRRTACEVGPLARVLVAYAKGHKDIKPLVDGTLKKLDVPATALFSTLGRTAARGSKPSPSAADGRLGSCELVGNLKSGDTKTYEPWEMPDSGMGVGLNDVPRGSLGHWIKIKDGKIKNYQYVVPSTWNLCGRDGPASSARWKRPSSARPSPIPNGPWKCCVRCTASTRVSPAPCT
jgi:[NiFe] hydrogenase large subunit